METQTSRILPISIEQYQVIPRKQRRFLNGLIGLQHIWSHSGSLKRFVPEISVNSLKKYMECLARRVEEKVASRLPEKFALIMDGWSAGTTLFIGLFASNSNGLGDP